MNKIFNSVVQAQFETKNFNYYIFKLPTFLKNQIKQYFLINR